MPREKILILVKTCPEPSRSYVETTCVAGITEAGEMRRIFPVPFRFLDEEKRFKKWQWIMIETKAAVGDNRRESRRGNFDTIQLQELMKSGTGWRARMEWLKRVPRIQEFLPLDQGKRCTPAVPEEVSLALYILDSPVSLEIKKGAEDWTPKEKEALLQSDNPLFSRRALDLPPALKKIPYDFYYLFKAPVAEGRVKEVRLKITDWEIGVLYWRCVREHGDDWERFLRNKYEAEANKLGPMILMGNMHRHPDQWLAISVFFPPRQYREPFFQKGLFEE